MSSAQDHVAQAAAAIVEAFAANDDARYFSLFAPEAVFVFHTTPQRLRSRAEYESEMASWRAEAGFRVLECRSVDPQVIMLGDDAAAFVHDVRTRLVMDGSEQESLERETIVFVRRDGEWIAVHEHLSPAPS